MATVTGSTLVRDLTDLTSISTTGNITVGGTVDGRDVATDGSKLDGIEASATADQTAAEILTAIKTVDGSGSGLDADTLDSLQVTSLVSNNYFQDNSGGGGGNVSNSYLTSTFTTNNYVDGRFTSNNFVKGIFTSNNYVQTQLGTKLNSSSYTASDVLTKIKTVDGSGSGLDADTLDGLNSTSLSSNNYIQTQLGTKLNSSSYTASDVLTKIKTVDGSGSGLDADTLDGLNSTSLSSNNYLQSQLSTKLNSSSYTASDVLTKIKTVDGSGSGLDADTLDGLQGSSYSSNNYIINHYTSNNYIQTFVAAEVASIVDSAPAALDTLNELAAALGDDANFSTTVSNQIGIRSTNTYVNSTFSSNNYLQSQLSTKLNSSSYTAADVLNKIKTVDGSGSGLDADTLDGLNSTSLSSNNYVQTQLGTKLNSSSYTASDVLTKIKTVDGSGSGLDADTLDGLQGSSYSSNNYITNHYASNNYIQTYVSSQVASVVDSAPAALDTLNELAAALGDDANFSTTVSNQIGIRSTNTYVNSTFSSNNYLQGQLGTKLNSSSYTASDVLTKIKTVDGSGSGLDADLLDGLQGSSYSSNNYIQTQLGTKLNSSSYTASDVLTKIKTVDGSGSGLDADTLDSLQVTSLVSNNYFQDNSGGGGGGATGGGSDEIFYENDQTVTTNYTLTTNKNAMSAGPITVNGGVTVTIPSGASWTVV